MTDLVSLSKVIARALRHRPDAAGIRLDKRGWCRVDELLEGLARAGTSVTREELDEIVRTNDKKRFALSKDGALIRASQGHSVHGVELGLRPKKPPSVLFHGTMQSSLPSIERKGLLPMRRHHVHLSVDLPTARAVGERRGPSVVLGVEAGRMQADGYSFWVSENGIWLVLAVPPMYLSVCVGQVGE